MGTRYALQNLRPAIAGDLLTHLLGYEPHLVMPFETNQYLFAGQGDDDTHEDDGDLTEKLSQITRRPRLMNFHRTLAIGFPYTPAPVRTRNYLMKRDAKLAPSVSSPCYLTTPPPIRLLLIFCGRTENALRKRGKQFSRPSALPRQNGCSWDVQSGGSGSKAVSGHLRDPEIYAGCHPSRHPRPFGRIGGRST
jgi:hypothetical protein